MPPSRSRRHNRPFRQAWACRGIDNLSSETLVIPLTVKVFKKFVDRMLKVALAEENHSAGDLSFERTVEAFDVGIAIR
jgi:hypothetical protein